MYKALLFTLLLPICSNAQKLELSFGHSIISYRTIVGPSGHVLETPHFTMKAMYNIAEQAQVGINFLSGERTQAVDAFFNWSMKGTNNYKLKFYIGGNVGYISYNEQNFYQSEYVVGKGIKGGMQVGITTPPTSRVGFYAETGFNYAVGDAKRYSEGSHGRPSYVSPKISNARLTYIPFNLGVRFRFLYTKKSEQHS